MVDEIIAKSRPLKTLKEHTDEVLEAFHNLKKLKDKLGINLSEDEWDLLKKAVFYHDFGKAYLNFQHKIRGQPVKNKNIPHNLVSIAFLPEDNELLLKLIAFHHWREFPDLSDGEIKSLYSNINIKKIQEYFNISLNLIKEMFFKKRLELLKRFYSYRINQVIDLQKNKKFIILLGLLNRIDHSASAGVPIEAKPFSKFKMTKDFLLFKTKRPWQLEEIKDELKRKNGVVIASTGMGKTETALLWADIQKTFYTLPIRTSVTAMYNRFTNLFGEDKVGLLHSDALNNLFFETKKLSSTDDAFYCYDMAKNLSYPLIVCTADQLFSATLKYLGFEKIYASLSYSKVIIDEIQAYSPHTMAIIIHGLNEIRTIGGQFLIITATFPSFLKDKINEDFQITKIPVLKKHKLQLINESLDGKNLKKLVEKFQSDGKKILIVCNTVKKSQNLYKSLEEFAPMLLHARFNRIDRKLKEGKVLEKNFKGILIATQIVEVSLDIDFDVLITEMAPLDVLVQRMGRIYRRFKEDGEFYPCKPNVYIFTEEISGLGEVYETEIIKKSIQYLHNGVISEKDKFEIITKFYSEDNLKNTHYWLKFNNALNGIRNYSVITKAEAQEIFRDISQMEIIPYNLLEYEVQNETILKALDLKKGTLKNVLESVKIKNKKEKIFVMELIKDFMVPLSFINIKNSQQMLLSNEINNLELKELLDNIWVVKCKYDSNIGVIFENEKQSFI